MPSHTKSNESAVVLLAHHDDEFFLGLHLKYLDSVFSNIYLCYLTYTPDIDEQRVFETKKYIEALKLSNTSVVEFGKQHGILDGQLYKSLEKAEGAVREFLVSSHPATIIFPAWEGGHQDHDAISLLGRLLGKSFRLKIFDFGLYSCSRIRPPFFGLSGFYQTENEGPWIETGSYIERLKQSFLAHIFQSQRKSFLGIWPIYFWQRLLGRKVVLSPAIELPLTIDVPHQGPLHYEYRFKVEWKSFQSEVNRFFQKYKDKQS